MKRLLQYTFLILSIVLVTHIGSYGKESLGKRLIHSSFQKGLEWMQLQQYETAQHHFNTYITQCPDSQYAIEAAYYAALCAIKLERADGEEQLQQFIKKYPYHQFTSLAYYELGNLYGTRQDYTTCIKYYLIVDANQLDEHLKAELQYRLAYAYLNQKDFDQALDYFNKIKQQDSPYTAASNYYAGYLALKKGDYKSALTDLQKAEKNAAYESVVPYLILEVLYQSKKYKEAIAYATSIENKYPDLKNQEDIALLTAESYFLLQNYTAAIQHYENYISLQPADMSQEAQYRLAYALYKVEENYKAIKYFKELALREDNLAQLASYYMGVAYIKINQKNLALAALNQARQLEFDLDIQTEAAFQYAQLSYELGHLKLAIESLQEFKKVYPTSQHMKTINNLLSQVYLQTQHYDLAIAHIEGLSEKTNTMLQVYQKATFYKGNAFFNQEAYESAITWLQKSLRYPLDMEITLQTHLWLAESYVAQQIYDQAMAHYQAVLAAENKKDRAYYQDALYGMGYVYFNTGKYQQALPLLLQYANATNNANNWRSDALVRAADCYYVTKAYTQALALYDKTQTDYPAHNSYQKALIYELTNKPAEAKQNLENIIKTYAHTPYYEKALFEYAYLALQHQDYQGAVSNFTKLIQQKPYSPLIPDALLHRAVAYVNLKQYAEAGKDYETLLIDYPTHPNTQNALIELPKLVNLEGKPEKLQQYLDIYKAKNPSSDKLEVITFEAAKNLFYNQNYQQAIEQLHKFMTNYPASKLADEAGFLLGEAYYRLGDDTQALQQYQQAVANKQSAFYNRILLRIAAISYKQQDFVTALTNYAELKDRATNKKESYFALEGMMKSNEALERYDEVVEIAHLIIKLGNITVNAVSQATLYLAKAAMQQAKYPEALQQFQQVVTGGQDVYAAEAQYLIAKIHFQLGNYKQSLEALFVLTKQFTDYPIWVNQGFLLMADDYIALHETFQAKATLQSIIDHATDATLVQQAQEKLQALVQQQTEADNATQASQEQTAVTDSEFKTLEEEEPTP